MKRRKTAAAAKPARKATVVDAPAYRKKNPKFPEAAGAHVFAPDRMPQSFTSAPVVDTDTKAPQPWRDLPPPTGTAPYHLNLGQVLDAAAITRIQDTGTMIFHAVGATVGVNTVTYQENVATYMGHDFLAGAPEKSPSFFYHLGDVVYYDGEAANYFFEFYEPYTNYHGPIFAIPGNHDGDVNPSVGGSSLEAFVRNFCAQAAVITQDNRESPRTAMTQPNVYWTLDTPLATIIGLYSNCPEGGRLAPAQVQWLVSELSAAPKDRALVLSVHHPLYSAYGTKPAGPMNGVVKQACASAKRSPDIVLTGHVHNYQRFSAALVPGKTIPVIVGGAGGYNKKLHILSTPFHTGKPPFKLAGSDGILESFNDQQHGYLKLTVTASPRQILCEYYAVPEPDATVTAPLTPFDSVTVSY